jgi:hypothetical protein
LGIALDGKDDPFVVLEKGSGNPPTWHICIDSFSQWIYCLVHDGILLRRARFGAQATSLSQSDLKHLRREFKESSITYWWPCEFNYRFSGNTGDLLIWACPGQADWWLAPHKGKERQILKQIFNRSNLAESLYAIDQDMQHIIDELRKPTRR